MGRNTIGALIALLWFSPSAKSLNRKYLYVMRGAVVMLVLSQFIIVSTILLDEWRINSRQSVLSQFDSVFELGRWGVGEDESLVTEPVLDGQYALRVSLSTDQYSGVSLKYFNRDWQHSTALILSMFNPLDEVLGLVVRINDKLHREGWQQYTDRFNRSVELEKGWNQVRIALVDVKNAPADRMMDLSSIESIGVFSVALPEPRVFYMDSVQLVKTAP